jgi:purine nucleosidase
VVGRDRLRPRQRRCKMVTHSPQHYGCAVTALSVLFDCDPGKDDAFALFLALAMPQALEVVAVTAVAGNVAVDRTVANARRIVEAAGRPEIPVFRGCPRPIIHDLFTAEDSHGADGLGGSGLPDAREPHEAEHAVNALIRLLDAAEAPLTIAAIGPLTNIAMVLIQRPDLADKIRHLAVMGGARGRGNVTEFAEFNFLVDPHAAHVSMSIASPISLVTLDATRNLRPPLSWFEAMEGFGEPGRALAGMWRESPIALYDVAVTGLLLWPDLFSLESCDIRIVLDDEQHMARSVVSPGEGNCRILSAIDEETFLERTVEAMKNYRR